MAYKISVVIPAYNAEKHIGDAIKSVLSQEYPAYEIIVIDDGSTDKTKEVVNRYSLENIFYVFQQNSGPSKARNTGILKSSGDLIAFLDADDVWYTNHLADAVELFNENSNVFWFSSAFKIEHSCNEIKPIILKTRNNIINYFEYSLKNTFIHTSAIIIHRKVFSSIGLFNENWKFGEDLNMWVRIALQFPDIGYCAKPGSVFKKTTGSLTFNKHNYNMKNTLKVLYFTNREVEVTKNKLSIKLINQWIEDSIYSAILLKNNLILKYIKKRWKNRIGLFSRFLLVTYYLYPLIIIRAFNYLKKNQRKFCK